MNISLLDFKLINNLTEVENKNQKCTVKTIGTNQGAIFEIKEDITTEEFHHFED